MFGTNLEVIELKEEVRQLKRSNDDLRWQIRDLNFKLEKEREKQQFNIEKAKFDLAKTMEQKLIESDLKRVEAVAKLNTYIEMDTKDDRKHTQKMLEEAIKSLGKQQVVVQK